MGIRGKKAWHKKFARRIKKQEEAASALDELNVIREKVVTMLEPLMKKKSEKKASKGKAAVYTFAVAVLAQAHTLIPVEILGQYQK